MGTMTDAWALAWQLVVRADPELVQIATLSLQVSATACVVGTVVGLLVGAWLAVARFAGHAVVVWLVNTLLALPAVVVGLAVYLLLSRAGPLGAWGLLFTPQAMVIAQSILVTPLIAALTRRLVLAALADGGEQLRSLGARPMTASLLMLVHDRRGVATIVLTAFGRAVAEVGAVMIVGGNIAGVTRVMTTAIALETSKGDLALALALGLVLLAIVGAIHGAIGLLQWLGGRSQAVPASAVDPLVSRKPLPRATAAQAQDPAPLVLLERATVCFGSVVALREVSLTLRRGDRLVLVGANGSGKTTLLRLLHGMLPCTGRCERVPLQPEGRLPHAAMLFQRSFMLDLSVWRNLWVGLWLAGVPVAERAPRCREALALVGLLAQARRPARVLSGGQQQRLGLARAWALRPDVLFLDEPTASLDPVARNGMEVLVEDIAARGTTIVMSTHNLGQARRLATRLAYLHGGQLVVERPVHSFFNGEDLPPQAAAFLREELG